MAYILIVDSQAEFRQQLLRSLEEAGHRGTAVGTITEATKLLQDDVPDLLATDAVLTDGSSTNLTRQAEAAGSKTLMMTGSADRIVEFDGAGQPYLSKPFTPEAFLQRVRDILGEAAG
jgi:DNA-binding response OmpR family regulator